LRGKGWRGGLGKASRWEHSRPFCLGILVGRHLFGLEVGRWKMGWAVRLAVVAGCRFGLWVRGRGLRRRCLDHVGLVGRGLCHLPFLGLCLGMSRLRWRAGSLDRWSWWCSGWNVVELMGQPFFALDGGDKEKVYGRFYFGEPEVKEVQSLEQRARLGAGRYCQAQRTPTLSALSTQQ
jgi:hypothetical protein